MIHVQVGDKMIHVQVEVADVSPDPEDLCGLCGHPGADKFHHPVYWPGEQRPGSKFVHAGCEEEECRRAHSVLSPAQREAFLKTC